MLVMHVKFLDLCSRVTKMARAEAPFPNYPGWPTTRQTDEKDLHLKARSKTVIVSVFACKLKALTNSRGSYPLADMEISDNTLDQVHSIFIR